MSGYTKGPWSINECGDGVYGGDGTEVKAHGLPLAHARKTPEAVANVKLILAAPDLLAALESIEWTSAKGFTFCPSCNYTEQSGHALNCIVGKDRYAEQQMSTPPPASLPEQA